MCNLNNVTLTVEIAKVQNSKGHIIKTKPIGAKGLNLSNPIIPLVKIILIISEN